VAADLTRASPGPTHHHTRPNVPPTPTHTIVTSLWTPWTNNNNLIAFGDFELLNRVSLIKGFCRC